MKRTLLPFVLLLSLGAALLGACSSSDGAATPMPHFAVDAADDEADSLPTAQEPSDADLAAAAAKQKELREQKKALLVEQRLDLARDAFADGRLLEAEEHLVKALEVDPGNPEVMDVLEQVQVALGKASTDLTGSSEDVRLRTLAKAEQLRTETEAEVERGEALLAQGDYDGAIASARIALANVHGTTLVRDWGGLEERAQRLLEDAEASRDLALAAERDREVAAAYAKLKEEEQRAAELRRRRLDGMMEQALEAFDAYRFDEVERLTTAILREEPLDERAQELRDTARRASHEDRQSRFVVERRERFRQWEAELAEARVLQEEVLEYPDPEFWREISERRREYIETPEDSAADPQNAELVRQLSDQRIPGLVFDGETSLEAVIEPIRTFTSVPIVVTPDAVEAVDSNGVEFNLDLPHEMTVLQALNIITDQAGEEVTWTVRNGVVYVTSTQRAYSNLVLHPHDIRDLIAQLTDFTPPKIDKIRLPDEEYDDEEPTFGGVAPDPVTIYDPDNLETLIKQSVAPGTWDGEIEGVSLRIQNGLLFVRHTPKVQKELHEFLQNLRTYTSSMVTIEARFITINKDFLEEIGVDWRGNGGSPDSLDLVVLDDVNSGSEDNASNALDNDGPGLPSGAATNPSAGAFLDQGDKGDIRARTENILGAYGSRLGVAGGLTMQLAFLDDLQYNLIVRAVQKKQHAEELTGTVLTAQNTQRAYATMLNQITYVQDFDVEVALASIIADPSVGVISDGIVLDVRPTIFQDRKYIMLELRPTVATLLRPIPEFTSSLAGLTTPVTLQLPELQVATANTNAIVPDGGAVVIGGLKQLFRIDQRSQVPFLGDIPLLSLLFKTEGTADENKDVILVIRAYITDANEVTHRLDSELGRD